MFTLGGQKKSFGIDIGTQTIKIVEMSKVNSYNIDNYIVWNNDIDNIIQQKGSDAALSTPAITKIIEVMLAESGMQILEAYIALPTYLALFAVIQVPILGGAELVTAVPLAAKQHIPVPLNSVQLDWINLGKNKINQDQYDILIIAMPNKVIDRYFGVSQALGIKVKGVELDCFSTLRSIDLPKEQVCLIDIGARNSTVMVVNSNKEIQTIQAFDFGGNHITEAIESVKGCSTLEAEGLKKQNGVNGSDSKVTELIKSKISSFIVTDVMRLLTSIDDKTGISTNHIVIVGGSSKMVGLKEYIDEIFTNQFHNPDINVSLASPIANLSVKGVMDDNITKDIWQDLILSIGVSLKNYID